MLDIKNNLENGPPEAWRAGEGGGFVARAVRAAGRAAGGAVSLAPDEEPTLGNALDGACGLFRVMRPGRWHSCGAISGDAEISRGGRSGSLLWLDC